MPLTITLEDAEVPVVQEALGEYFSGQIHSAAVYRRQEAQDKARVADTIRTRLEAIAEKQEAVYPKSESHEAEASPTAGADSPSVPALSASQAGSTPELSPTAHAVTAPDLVATKPAKNKKKTES